MSRSLLVVILLVAAAAAAAVGLNLLLLGRASAQSDPVGTLSPKAHLPAAPAWTIRPATIEHEHDRADD
jgi:hypothetical protein